MAMVPASSSAGSEKRKHTHEYQQTASKHDVSSGHGPTGPAGLFPMSGRRWRACALATGRRIPGGRPCSSMSIPTGFRPRILTAIKVVPLPQKGSKDEGRTVWNEVAYPD